MLIRRFIFSRRPKHNLAPSKGEDEPAVVLRAELCAGQEAVVRSEDKPPSLHVLLMLSCFLREG